MQGEAEDADGLTPVKDDNAAMRSLARRTCVIILLDCYNCPSGNNSRLLEELVEIGFSNIWTTNFDNAIENLYQNRGVLINKVFQDADFSNIDIITPAIK